MGFDEVITDLVDYLIKHRKFDVEQFYDQTSALRGQLIDSLIAYFKKHRNYQENLIGSKNYRLNFCDNLVVQCNKVSHVSSDVITIETIMSAIVPLVVAATTCGRGEQITTANNNENDPALRSACSSSTSSASNGYRFRLYKLNKKHAQFPVNIEFDPMTRSNPLKPFKCRNI